MISKCWFFRVTLFYIHSLALLALCSIFEHATIKPSNLYIDAISLAMINGSTVDYATELIGSSFKVVDNPRSKGSGCGCGTSWELK